MRLVSRATSTLCWCVVGRESARVWRLGEVWQLCNWFTMRFAITRKHVVLLNRFQIALLAPLLCQLVLHIIVKMAMRDSAVKKRTRCVNGTFDCMSVSMTESTCFNRLRTFVFCCLLKKNGRLANRTWPISTAADCLNGPNICRFLDLFATRR